MLRSHLAYSAWATSRLLHAVEQIPEEHLHHDFQTSDRTILRTLVHIFAADRIWLARVRGESPQAFVSDADYHLSVLREQWPPLLANWQNIPAPETVIHYQDLKGNPYESPLWEIVLHVVNHATHHRGQVSGFLRSLGHTPPPLDLNRYYRVPVG